MNNQTSSPLAFAALALALAFGLGTSPAIAQDWSGRGRLQGEVIDEAGKPVEGAEVSLYYKTEGNGPAPLETDKKGRFSYLGLTNGEWNVLIRYPGYKESVGTAGVNEFGSTEAFTVTLVPDSGSAIQHGDELLEQGRYAEARGEFEKAMANLPPERQVLLRTRIGDTYLKEGNTAAARTEYEAALPQLDAATQIPVRLHLAETYLKESKPAEARAQYEQILPALAEPAEKSQIHRQIAQTYGMEGNNAAAIETLKKALEASPGEASILQLLADLLSREGRETEATEYLAQMPAGTEVPPDLVMNIAIRLYNDGDLEGALSHFERAVAENPEMPEAYYYRGVTYLGLGKEPEAKIDFQKLLEIAPDHERAAEVQSFLAELDG